MRLGRFGKHAHFFWCFLLLFFSFSCNKDSDLLREAIFEKDSIDINQQNTSEPDNEESDEVNVDSDDVEQRENRTTVFPVLNDAYVENGKGYDVHLLRLEENHRVSYLMFNLSQIDSIGGNIISAKLKLEVSTDDGNGTIEVTMGTSNNWSEANLTEESAPQTGVLLGTIQQDYLVSEKVDIDLDVGEIPAGYFTLILSHVDGNDLAFASKENDTDIGGKLEVTYDVSVGASQIIVAEEDSEAPEEVEDTVDDEPSEDDPVEEPDSENTQENTAPSAVATATPIQGEAPLQVSFTGSNSFDDKGIVNYHWNFPNNPSSSPNTTRIFDVPGVYDITLTVTDAEGLQDNMTIPITVTEPAMEPEGCATNGGLASDLGFKSWCWNDISIPNYSGSKGVAFSQGQLYIDSECYEKQVTKAGDQLRFRVNPTNPSVGDWCSRDFNMRAEIRTAPWDVRHTKGTEEWFGWTYTFGNDYIIDQKNQWKFFQVHPGIVGLSPQIGLEIIHADQFNGHNAGEIYVTNATTSENYSPTGIIPSAGETIEIVVHTIWDDAQNGLLQVWINGNMVYDRQVSTVYASYPWGGNAKWGIYKWPWSSENGVQESQQQSIDHLETYMGALRIITRRPGDPNYGSNSYSQVAPR